MERERRRIKDIDTKGLVVDDVYVVRRKDPPRQGKKGTYFFTLTITDASGDIRVNYWGGLNEGAVRQVFDEIKEGSVVRVKGSSDRYNDAMVVQVNPTKGDIIEAADGTEFDLAEFVGCSDKDPEEMYQEMWSIISQIENANIQAMLHRMFENPALVRQFKAAPASVSYHCAWLGGLLEHTLNVMRICDFIARTYPQLDRDLLLASAVLHDVGKVRCYTVTTTISESVPGRLMGHIVIGAQMVEEACTGCPSFPDELKTKLVHMVLASHGSNEKGSPAVPSIPEALALNFADEMDAKLERFIRARDNGGPEDLFVIDRHLNTKVYLG